MLPTLLYLMLFLSFNKLLILLTLEGAHYEFKNILKYMKNSCGY